MLKKIALLLPKSVKTLMLAFHRRLFDGYAIKSYSQEGEDMILKRIFGERKNGFYVDVGAHHPHRFSNTYVFYKSGWNGINIEPNPDIFKTFETDRRRDKNLQLGVSDREGLLTYYFFDEPALNTFDEEIVNSRLATTPYKVVGKSDVPVERLDQILEKNLPQNCTIDFLSIDVEGFDLAVLKSNNWNIFRPKLVLVEALDQILEDAMLGEVCQFMKIQKYKLFAKTFNTFFFCEEQFLSKKNGN